MIQKFALLVLPISVTLLALLFKYTVSQMVFDERVGDENM
jgi:hypothetical protein